MVTARAITASERGRERAHRGWMLALVVPLIAAIGALQPARAESKPLSVVATTGMIADAARRIGGEDVEVRALMGPGVDPHAFRQTRTDILAMARAGLVLRHGLYLEAQMEAFFHRLGRRVDVVAVAEALPVSRLRAHDTYKNKFDPHVWMAPGLWSKVTLAVRDALARARPEKRAAFAQRTADYQEEIAALERYATRVLASVPEERRVLVTAHDAFGYFGREFGFAVHGIQGISTESEAGLARIKELVDLLVARKVTAVFVESSVPARSVRALVEGAAARGHQVSIGGELFSDAMGPPGTYEGTYIGMIDHNVTTIARALGGQAPAGGMNGRLAKAQKGK